MNTRTILVWFRNDLRTHDNECLVRALEQGNQILPVYCFDPSHYEMVNPEMRKTGVLRAEFIRRNVQALRETFREAGGDLYVVQGRPEEVLPELCATLNIDEVYHHREVAFEETEASARVEAALWKQQINLRHFIGHTLYHKEDLPFPIKDIPDQFNQFRRKAERESMVRQGFEQPKEYLFRPDIPLTDIPTLEELGYTSAEVTHAKSLNLSGGEKTALALLEQLLSAPENILDGTELSPYLSIGSLSPNTYYHRLMRVQWESGNKKKGDLLLQHLIWRDYFRFMFKKHGNRFFQPAGLSDEAPPIGSDSEENFERWRTATTGNDQIDKLMSELNETGVLSEHDRLLTATYLVDGLEGDWLKGAAWFEDRLLDYNPSNNYGSWAHVAGVGSSQRDNKPLDLSKIFGT